LSIYCEVRLHIFVGEIRINFQSVILPVEHAGGDDYQVVECYFEVYGDLFFINGRIPRLGVGRQTEAELGRGTV
jgi:hypothetical protein